MSKQDDSPNNHAIIVLEQATVNEPCLLLVSCNPTNISSEALVLSRQLITS